MSNTLANQVVASHFTFPMGTIRLRTIYLGLKFEIKRPGMRLTGKATKCSTILRQEFGLSGKPPKLLAQFEALLIKHKVLDAAVVAREAAEQAAEDAAQG